MKIKMYKLAQFQVLVLFQLILISSTQNVNAQINYSQTYYQIGLNGYENGYSGSTPEEAGKKNCSARNTAFGRVEEDVNDICYWGASCWGFLYCSKSTNPDWRVGIIVISYCSDNHVLIDGVCQATPIDDAQKDHGKGCVGNPCNPATGNKYQMEIDFQGPGNFSRYYNSQNLIDLGLGKGWRHNFLRRLIVNGNTIVVASETGRGELWSKVNGVWQGPHDSDYSLTELTPLYQIIRSDGSVEIYNRHGRLISIEDSNNRLIQYAFNSEYQLGQVVNQYGQVVSFNYISDHISTITDSSGSIYRYAYDDKDNLVSVVYPDGTPLDDTDNPRRTYLYQNTEYPNHLTGIIDENGDRYATFAYDADGKAISTEHALTTNPVGQEKFELDYQGAN